MFRPIPTTQIPDLRISGGSNSPARPNISVIVISTNSDGRVLAAVNSLLHQGQPAEIILVNSGKGSLKPVLGEIAQKVVLVETSHRQYAGGARNIGIRISTAPVIAFLAADCLATPGWLASRISDHYSYRSVASALRPAPNPAGCISFWAWASHIAIHHTRMPSMDANAASLFGMSYDRTLFNEIGLFNEGVRVGEDRILNDKVRGIQVPHWNPRIITLHRYPESMSSAIKDLFARGRRQAMEQRQKSFRARLFFSARKLRFDAAAYMRLIRSLKPGVGYGRLSIFTAFSLSVVRSMGNIIPVRLAQ